MKVTITGKKMAVTEGIRNRVDKKIGKLEKFFKDDADVRITLSTQRERQIAEVTIYSAGVIFRAEEAEDDLYAAIDRVIEIIERQIRKHKTMLSKKLRQGAWEAAGGGISSLEDTPEEKEFNVVKVKKFAFKPMSVEEAILQMNLLGHSFFVFHNDENERMSIVYKRKDGNYAMIEQQ